MSARLESAAALRSVLETARHGFGEMRQDVPTLARINQKDGYAGAERLL